MFKINGRDVHARTMGQLPKNNNYLVRRNMSYKEDDS